MEKLRTGYRAGNSTAKERIKTALLLAAGTGSRLQPLTDDLPKCLTAVSGVTILKRLVDVLCSQGFNRLVVVVGHLDVCLRSYLDSLRCGMTIDYITSDRYRTTNNIYSLWMARNVIQEPFLLLECDLIFEDFLLDEMLEPDRIAVSHILPWMNGTIVTLDDSNHVQRFFQGSELRKTCSAYKTVNMYSFSRASWKRVTRRLELYISAGRVKGYYETVFSEMVNDGSLSFEAVFFDDQRWYEIDTIEDLHAAELLFPNDSGRLASGAAC